MSFDLQPAFRALADPTRRDILMMLAGQDLTIGEVAQNFDITRAAVKKHLTVLEEGELITVTKKGREAINQLNPNAIRPAIDWLNYFETFWDTKLTNLQSALEQDMKDHSND